MHVSRSHKEFAHSADEPKVVRTHNRPWARESMHLIAVDEARLMRDGVAHICVELQKLHPYRKREHIRKSRYKPIYQEILREAISALDGGLSACEGNHDTNSGIDGAIMVTRSAAASSRSEGNPYTNIDGVSVGTRAASSTVRDEGNIDARTGNTDRGNEEPCSGELNASVNFLVLSEIYGKPLSAQKVLSLSKMEQLQLVDQLLDLGFPSKPSKRHSNITGPIMQPSRPTKQQIGKEIRLP